MSFRSHFRRQQQRQQPTADAISTSNNNNHNKRDSISRFLSKTPRTASSSFSTMAMATKQQSPLAAFDACIEACDALAASSLSTATTARYTPPAVSDQHEQQSIDDDVEAGSVNDDDENGGSTTNNTTSVIADCSVLVSPDGALLFTPQSNANDVDLCRSNTHNYDDNKKYPWTNICNSNGDGAILNEDYESAIICGNDLHPSGDYASNGFTARGWDCDAATAALRSSCEVLNMMERFVEEVALSRKEEAARVLRACESWSLGRERLLSGGDGGGGVLRRRGGNKTNNSSSNHNTRHSRLGPLLSTETDLGTNISIALETMEEYFSTLAETDSQQWRDVCLESTGTSSAAPSSFRGMLPQIREAATKAQTRTSRRETALNDIRMRVTEAQNILVKQKEWASNQWKRVQMEDAKIDQLLVERREEQMQQHHQDSTSEQRQRDVRLLDRIESEPDISEDVWELVKGVAAMEDFGHTGYSPRVTPKVSVADANGIVMSTTMALPHRQINRADVEKDTDIQDIRMVALAADESVEDASSQLLNIMSKQDTTMRSARVASETCLLSECNAVHKCLRSLVAIERDALEERARRLQMLETAVDAIDVRKDIDIYIQNDKLLPGGSSRTGDDDDGGIAAALAVLNSHVDGSTDSMPHPNIERPNHFEGWGESSEADNDDTDDVEPEIFGEVVNLLFERDQGKTGPDSPRRGKRERTLSESYKLDKEEKVALAASALELCSKRGQYFRQTILYELNNQRSKKTEVEGEADFESLCRLFDSFLSGCGQEAIDVSNAKMAMILSQTFYYVDDRQGDNTVDDRESRVYVKHRISYHEIWTADEFWDHALEQCVAESLQKSGVLLNYVKTSVDVRSAPNNSIKWHDLSPSEYADAAAQVHSVVFAQLGTLAHSMLEMNVSGSASTARACNFVRRLSIRYQLPLNLRITLLNHIQNNNS